MIVLFRSFGNHSNRLFQNLHFEAFCMEYGLEYANPAFRDMREYYVSPVETKYNYKAMFYRTIAFSRLRKLGLFRNVITFRNENKNNIEILKNRLDQDLYVDGWGFRVHDLTVKYQDLFIERYSLKDEYFENNALYKKLLDVNRDTTSIIGVHIRRRDYKKHQGGIYYFNDKVYEKYINQLRIEITKKFSKQTVFIIFSDEITGFQENSDILISENIWYLDHLLMSKCDFLIGPPSTFTSWASYIGKNKYFHIKDDSGEIYLNRFSYCEG